MKSPSLEPLLADVLLVLGVLGLSLVVYAVAIQPWLAKIEVVH
jgi:hypothetical protein